MEKYKVGDMVWVREDLEENKRYFMEHDSDIGDSVVSKMVKFRGEKMKIAGVTDGGKYHLKGTVWNWTDGMFAGKVYEKDDIKIGDRVRLRDDLVKEKSYDGLTWLSGFMSQSLGKTYTVEQFAGKDLEVKETCFVFSTYMVAEVIKKEDAKMETSKKETTKAPSKKRDFKVGDIVVIRDWDDMKFEFGCTPGGVIPCAHSFVQGMKNLCGTRCRISKIEITGKITGKQIWLEALSGESIKGWSFSTDMIRHADTIKTGKIVITSDGRVTKARLFDGKECIKETMATCSPEDQFDFMTEAQISFERLTQAEQRTQEEKPKWNAKVVCVKAVGDFTKGKIYSVKEGCIENDLDKISSIAFSSLDELNDTMVSQFILLVE